ncbi:ATP phosphoribosyltransferase [Adlercreutzia sp. ZJ154]|uniref:ATP phosphoribosyltransferase n=1 Tax=Adlercreutzia sp. ZJ154 TaxID=2709790 RepID=UPI0013EB055E|nr:ATP phosphoribosyltransferase [Adlercreutzia sp. ZJ154]
MNLVTPLGFRDVLTSEAAEREHITRSVQDLFATRGYLPIETPTLEVMDVMARAGRLPASSFKFFDSQGDLLAMRPDVTLQIARMCATRMPDANGVLKFRYTQRVFREMDGQAQALARELTQIGIENIGCDSLTNCVEADTEVVGLCVQALSVAGVSNVVLAIATVAPLRSLLERSGAPDAWKSAVLNAYHASDFVEVDRLTDLANLDASTAPAYAQAIRKLPRIRGGINAIDEARSLVAPLGCTDGLDQLQSLCENLQSANLQAEILVDFSVISSFDYYTGIVFEAYSPYLGSPLGSGGRYDNMIGVYGNARPAAGFAFFLERAMEAAAAEAEIAQTAKAAASTAETTSNLPACRPLRIAVPKGALNEQAINCLEACGLNVDELRNPGRQLVIKASGVEYIIVRPSDAPAFVASGAADCGICGRDSIDEAALSVVELSDLRFGGCRFVVARPEGSAKAIAERYRRLGSIRVATKYPRITLGHYAKTGMQVEIVKLNGNIELAPLTGIAECIVDITATGTTLRQNKLEIVEDVLDSTARFFANPCALRTDSRIVELARKLADSAKTAEYDPIAGGTK